MGDVKRFTIDIPEAVIADLHHRLDITRWTDDFANGDWRYGANTAYIRDLPSIGAKRYCLSLNFDGKWPRPDCPVLAHGETKWTLSN